MRERGETLRYLYCEIECCSEQARQPAFFETAEYQPEMFVPH